MNFPRDPCLVLHLLTSDSQMVTSPVPQMLLPTGVKLSGLKTMIWVMASEHSTDWAICAGYACGCFSADGRYSVTHVTGSGEYYGPYSDQTQICTKSHDSLLFNVTVNYPIKILKIAKCHVKATLIVDTGYSELSFNVVIWQRTYIKIPYRSISVQKSKIDSCCFLVI